MAENIKIVTWETKEGCRSYHSKEITSNDLGLAKRCIENFEEKLQEGMMVSPYEWVEYFTCKAIVFGATSYREDVQRNKNNPLFPLILVDTDTANPEG